VTDQSAIQNLSGEWSLVNTIEKTSYPAYVNLHIGYRVVINQVGKEFTAEGEKVFEAYVQNKTPGAYRLFWCYGPDKGQITLIAITPHP